MMSPHQKHSTLKSLEQAWEEVSKMPTTTKCWDCKEKAFEGEYCNLWESTIPAEVLPKGCEKWEFDPQSPPF